MMCERVAVFGSGLCSVPLRWIQDVPESARICWDGELNLRFPVMSPIKLKSACISWVGK